MHRRTLAGLALAALAGLSFAAQADTLDRIQQTKKVRIAIDPNVPPWSFKDEKLAMMGSEYATAQLLAQDLGATLEMVPTNGASRIPLLMTDKVDLVVSALTITPEREKVILFSRPYSGTTTVIAAPKSMVLKSAADLTSKRIGVARGTVMDTDATKMLPSGAEIVRFEDEATTMTAVLSGQVDILAASTTIMQAINRRDPSKALESKLIMRSSLHGMAIRKGDTRLKAWIDAWIKTNMSNGRLQATFRQYQNADLPPEVVKAAQE